jgi:LPXTG-motif cell wall-anchored protein
MKETAVEIIITENDGGHGVSYDEGTSLSERGGLTYDESTGIYTMKISNNRGYVLPEAGGMGTRLFYIIGAVLAFGAGMLLVCRRRMPGYRE